MQFFMLPAYVPPPNPEAELPVTVQLFSVQEYVPPPRAPELPFSAQLFNVL